MLISRKEVSLLCPLYSGAAGQRASQPAERAGERCEGNRVKQEEVDNVETGDETLTKELKAGGSTLSKPLLLLVRTQLGPRTHTKPLS